MSAVKDPPDVSPYVKAVIDSLPKVLWFFFAVGVFFYLRQPILDSFKSGRIEEVGFATLDIKLAHEDFTKAAARVDAADGPPTPLELKSYVARIKEIGSRLIGAKVLWVTEQTSIRYLPERHALASLGISFDLARNNAEAGDLLDYTYKQGLPYDLVITDMHRKHDSDTTECYPSIAGSPKEAGCQTIRLVHVYYRERATPIVVYSKDTDNGLPAGALGGTGRFDELVGLVLDAVDRREPPTNQPRVESSTDNKSLGGPPNPGHES